ncbi:MAG: PilZ domain-containing protein [Candidatus Eisenbacteria bacterium]|uniref:PilZ domain-containing protein n=1 Tax=Eiseniibacteriota bacterium TaxID=2212470 RepID=A0A948RSZ5_UNCEI|nr:PilZ domain-containing protein [Candidatus Eisenbacteria bacterium]MBU2690315.1 PilZ domain-containing protein [Candidatus Eisenbacteria bacterium]
MAYSQGKDRRRYKRVPVRMVLEMEVGEEKHRTRLETLNMSAGGFSCRMDRPIEALTLLRLGLIFPAFAGREEAHEIDCTAVIVRCDIWSQEPDAGYEIAAAFTWITPQNRQLLSDYLEWYETVYLMGKDSNENRQAV